MWFLPSKKPPCLLYIHRRTVETVPPHVQNHLTGLPPTPPLPCLGNGLFAMVRVSCTVHPLRCAHRTFLPDVASEHRDQCVAYNVAQPIPTE